MRHHWHVRRYHYRTAARRCRAHRPSQPANRRRAPGTRVSRISTRRGTLRIAPAPIREPHGREGAGQGTSRAVCRDPDFWGRLAVKLLRLLGGRRS